MERQKIEAWRSALSQAADLSGYSLKTNAYGYRNHPYSST